MRRWRLLLLEWVYSSTILLEYQLGERLGCPRQAARRCIGRPHLLQLGQLPLNLSTAPKPQTPRSIVFALVHPPSSHLSLSTVPTSVMALLKLSTLALLALRAAAVFAAEVDVSQLFVFARLPRRIAIPISAPPCLGPRPASPMILTFCASCSQRMRRPLPIPPLRFPT